ncbi:MAG: ABC transporter permease [Actinomycetota bacterium]|nr:ABC transporter permease [Actinomycetota bacterium]
MTVTSATPASSPQPDTARSAAKTTWPAFRALLLRDLTVMRASGKEVLVRTFMHPLLLVFVFTYVFPKIGQTVEVDGGPAAFSTVLIAGVVALAIVFQGMQSVALPMVAEFGATNEIEDRVLAPIPIPMVALEKMVAGALQSLLAAVLVFPVAAIIPATPVHVRVDWPVLVTMLPLACIASAALGLCFGTFFEPRSVPALLGIFLLPLIFLGAVYYPWAMLTPIPWLKLTVLVNPLVYVSEGLRAALGAPVPHMPLVAVYGVLCLFTAVFTAVGIQRFKQRVLS